MAAFDEDKEHISQALQRQPESYSFTFVLLLEVPRGELEVLVVEEVVDKADDDVWVWKIPKSKIKNLNRLGLFQKTSENKLMDWGG